MVPIWSGLPALARLLVPVLAALAALACIAPDVLGSERDFEYQAPAILSTLPAPSPHEPSPIPSHSKPGPPSLFVARSKSDSKAIDIGSRNKRSHIQAAARWVLSSLHQQQIDSAGKLKTLPKLDCMQTLALTLIMQWKSC